jgi:hypothetical protein
MDHLAQGHRAAEGMPAAAGTRETSRARGASKGHSGAQGRGHGRNPESFPGLRPFSALGDSPHDRPQPDASRRASSIPRTNVG